MLRQSASALLLRRLTTKTTTTSSSSSLLLNRCYHATSIKAGMTPPLAPFQRNPSKFAPLNEDMDAVWDDGVAPELALDFDAAHISTNEGLLSFGICFTILFTFYQTIRYVTNDGKDNNPALNHGVDCIIPKVIEEQLKLPE